MIRVMLVDDHRIFRQGIATLFTPVDDMEVVAECGEGRAAVQLAAKIHADIIVMDISLPDIDGIEASKKILAQNPDTRILLLSMHKDPILVEKALEAGINGYVVKDDAFDNLIYAIRALQRDEKFINLSFDSMPSPPKTPPSQQLLTQREEEIVEQICEGHSSKAIANNLFISIKTVETHRANIMEKLGVKNVAQLVKYAIKKGIIEA
ncbi:MAG: response regulator transcription factor [Desulfobacteraceae bacterium]|nr:response regulator transcription factor [Desulfobacteraceae bacterium]